ncbi:hypothetical protein HDU97_004089 [Phlyctochytrium planicorne]|nr:hypothetical protein HDU97_004089 [Phlyctochytrium planicorne]
MASTTSAAPSTTGTAAAGPSPTAAAAAGAVKKFQSFIFAYPTGEFYVPNPLALPECIPLPQVPLSNPNSNPCRLLLPTPISEENRYETALQTCGTSPQCTSLACGRLRTGETTCILFNKSISLKTGSFLVENPFLVSPNVFIKDGTAYMINGNTATAIGGGPEVNGLLNPSTSTSSSSTPKPSFTSRPDENDPNRQDGPNIRAILIIFALICIFIAIAADCFRRRRLRSIAQEMAMRNIDETSYRGQIQPPISAPVGPIEHVPPPPVFTATPTYHPTYETSITIPPPGLTFAAVPSSAPEINSTK